MERESKWTKKYKDSIDCSDPKGFSQRAHCQGRKKKKMKKSEVINELNKIAEYLEDKQLFKEANAIHNLFVKIAKVPSEMESGHKSAPKGYPEKQKEYADPKNFKYPLDSEKHARAAWSYIHQERNRKGYSASELKSMEARIRKALKKYNVNIEEPTDAHKRKASRNRFASEFKNDYTVEFPMNLDDALNNYDSGTYSVDKKGTWEDAEPISDFREEMSDADLHQPAAVDDNHIIFFNEDEDHVEVMNMIPKHHLDTLHKNPSDETRRIKRADD